ncbi:MAG: thioredoxin family protein [Vicinamibacterales bacterium]
MTEVKVLGIGCANCRNTQALVEAVARDAGVPIVVEKVEDPQQFVTYGVMRTPGVVVNGQLVHAGGVPSREKVEGWFRTVATP